MKQSMFAFVNSELSKGAVKLMRTRITLLASWDVWASNHPIMELYGTEGTMNLPDLNFFGGELTVTEHSAAPVEKSWDHPFNVPNLEEVKANYRGAGLADMALAIAADRPHRCKGC